MMVSAKWVAGRCGVSALGVLMVLALLSVNAVAANLSDQQLQGVIDESMKAMWVGEDFGPELAQNQVIMRGMLQSGALPVDRLKSMLQKNIFPLLDNHRTSRYHLKAMEGRVNALLNPHLDWETVEELLWKSGFGNEKVKDTTATLTIGTLAPDGTPWVHLPRKTAIPKIEKYSLGKLKIKIFSGGVMGQDTDILRKMDVGQLDGCGSTALGIIKAAPVGSVLLLPGLFRNYEEIDYVMDKFRKTIDQKFEERGYALAALIDTGFFYIYSKNRITGFNDLKNRKVMTWIGEVGKSIWDQLGVSPIPVAVPEIISSLSTSYGDTSIGPPAWLLGMQGYQYINYIVEPPVLYAPAAIFVSTNTKYRIGEIFGISDNVAYNCQELIIHQFNALEPRWKANLREYNQKSLDAFESKCGIQLVELSDADKARLDEAARNVRENLAGKIFSRAFLEEVEAALDEYRQQQNAIKVGGI